MATHTETDLNGSCSNHRHVGKLSDKTFLSRDK